MQYTQKKILLKSNKQITSFIKEALLTLSRWLSNMKNLKTLITLIGLSAGIMAKGQQQISTEQMEHFNFPYDTLELTDVPSSFTPSQHPLLRNNFDFLKKVLPGGKEYELANISVGEDTWAASIKGKDGKYYPIQRLLSENPEATLLDEDLARVDFTDAQGNILHAHSHQAEDFSLQKGSEELRLNFNIVDATMPSGNGVVYFIPSTETTPAYNFAPSHSVKDIHMSETGKYAYVGNNNSLIIGRLTGRMRSDHFQFMDADRNVFHIATEDSIKIDDFNGSYVIFRGFHKDEAGNINPNEADLFVAKAKLGQNGLETTFFEVGDSAKHILGATEGYFDLASHHDPNIAYTTILQGQEHAEIHDVAPKDGKTYVMLPQKGLLGAIKERKERIFYESLDPQHKGVYMITKNGETYQNMLLTPPGTTIVDWDTNGSSMHYIMRTVKGDIPCSINFDNL